MEIRLKRAYDPPSPTDGFRVLVDRLWPRGIAKAELELDEWAKDIAPSTELRRTWHADPEAHDPSHFAAFADSYRAELASGPEHDALLALAEQLRGIDGPVTLIYSAKNTQQNNVVVLRDVLLEMLS